MIRHSLSVNSCIKIICVSICGAASIQMLKWKLSRYIYNIFIFQNYLALFHNNVFNAIHLLEILEIMKYEVTLRRKPIIMAELIGICESCRLDGHAFDNIEQNHFGIPKFLDNRLLSQIAISVWHFVVNHLSEALVKLLLQKYVASRIKLRKLILKSQVLRHRSVQPHSVCDILKNQKRFPRLIISHINFTLDVFRCL